MRLLVHLEIERFPEYQFLPDPVLDELTALDRRHFLVELIRELVGELGLGENHVADAGNDFGGVVLGAASGEQHCRHRKRGRKSRHTSSCSTSFAFSRRSCSSAARRNVSIESRSATSNSSSDELFSTRR